MKRATLQYALPNRLMIDSRLGFVRLLEDADGSWRVIDKNVTADTAKSKGFSDGQIKKVFAFA
jgi:hypothetical protein